ncbi:restriction endonuclease subunit S [[Mannheimia] succiniciproducens]|uniref:HsdS protein n=1 Tax=Mannheimia succiniciproducens (strain KCTC 0769BP / MBEL55E) TaxID=221988 RepID=Q65QI4_MANSM|nr:restriction endonuclease subunit S [[Mannheimia] succiniciproducens]AAU38776.1 HsdS protein [[Mannheimia] succiniciproducens MBEL55E]
MQKYDKYKPSGVEWLGDVPEGWEVTKIKYIAELTPKKSELTELDKECSFVPMEKLKLGNLVLDETRTISDVYNGYTYFEDNDLLIAKVTPCFENKNFVIAEKLVNGIGFGSSEIYVLRVKNCLNRYLFYRLQENTFMDLAIGSMTGAGGLKRIPSEFLNNYSIALPPLEEQTAIAHYLDQKTAYIDRLIDRQQTLLEKLSEKRTALITEAVCGRLPIAPYSASLKRGTGFDEENGSPNTAQTAPLFSKEGLGEICLKDSGIQWLGKVPEGWEVIRLRFLCNIQTGNMDTQDNEPDGIYPFYVRSPIIERSNNYTFEDDEAVLMAGDGVGAGKVFHYVQGKYGCHQRVYSLNQFQNITGRFLFYYLREFFSRKIEEGGAKSTVDSVRLPMLKDFPTCVPPLSEQTTITHYLDQETAKIDRLRTQIETVIERLKEYRMALITQVVTGKVKV